MIGCNNYYYLPDLLSNDSRSTSQPHIYFTCESLLEKKLKGVSFDTMLALTNFFKVGQIFSLPPDRIKRKEKRPSLHIDPLKKPKSSNRSTS